MRDLYSVRGRIFDIQRFSVHDGPGVRTIVFLKGCALRCRWCCNPESQSFEIQKMTIAGKEKTVGYDVSVGEVIPEVLKDRVYYRRSGGGLTLSGGETLLQIDFAEALFAVAKENGINTAIESTGFAPFENIERVLPYIDYYLMDIKHMNSKKHKAFTTQPNELILKNAPLIAAKTNLTVRVPVIPTFNDTEEEIGDIARFAATLPGVSEIHLLPYHRLGVDKYEGLGREFSLPDIVTPNNDKMLALKNAAEKEGLICRIGG